MFAVHPIALMVNALHVLVDVLDDLLGILGRQQTLVDHVFHHFGLLGEDQSGRLLRADGCDGLGIDVLQTAACDGDLRESVIK